MNGGLTPLPTCPQRYSDPVHLLFHLHMNTDKGQLCICKENLCNGKDFPGDVEEEEETAEEANEGSDTHSSSSLNRVPNNEGVNDNDLASNSRSKSRSRPRNVARRVNLASFISVIAAIGLSYLAN